MPISPLHFVSSTPGQVPDNRDQAIAAIDADDAVEWLSIVDHFGDHGAWDVSLAGVRAHSNNGLQLLMTSPGPGHHYVYQQGGPRSTWQGNFTNGDAVLVTDHSTAKLVINFDAYISAVGAQIQPQGISGDFNARLKVYWDATEATVEPEKKDFSGNSTSRGDGSALFIGVESSRRRIFRVEFSTYSRDGRPASLGINKLLINTR